MNGTGTSGLPALPPIQLMPTPASPYQTRIGAGSEDQVGSSGLNFPTMNFQQPKTSNTPSTPAMSTPGGALSSGAGGLQSSMQQAMQIYQQRNGALGGPFGNSTPPLNSNPGGVWAGNPTQAQVGPANPGIASPTTQAGTDAMNAESGISPGAGSGGGPMGGAGGAAGMGAMGIASGLSNASKAFGQESQTDLSLAMNPPRATVTGQPFDTFAFAPLSS
jgi:hypothetical protein